jgi:hypothetical protein
MKNSLVIENILRSKPHIVCGKEAEVKIAIPKDYIKTTSDIEEDLLDEIGPSINKIFVGGLPASLTEGKFVFRLR